MMVIRLYSKFSCRHNCAYCPNEKAHEGNANGDQPRSYLYSEPAVLRANENKLHNSYLHPMLV